MIVVGVDPHKFLLRAEALDAQGKPVGKWEGNNTAEAHAQCLAWIKSLGADVRVGIEGAYGFGRGLGRTLVGGGLVVFDINPRWTAAYRRTARRPHKNDSNDARAAAQVVLRDGDDLPRFQLDEAAVTLDLLTSERDCLIAEMTRRRNRLHAHLVALNLAMGSLSSRSSLLRLQELLPASMEGHDAVLLDVVRRQIARLIEEHDELERLTKEVEELAAEHYRELTEIVGVGLVTAAVLAAELGAPGRFTSDAQLAAYTGVAPIEASSAGGDAASPEPRRQPPAERRVPSHRPHPTPGPPARPGIYRAQARRGTDRTRSPPLPQALHRSRRLPGLAPLPPPPLHPSLHSSKNHCSSCRLNIGVSPIRDYGYALAITFEDPDEIALELFWTKPRPPRS